MRAFVCSVAVLASMGQTARADSTHKGQFGASARLGVGARGIATYENRTYCGSTDTEAEFGYASVCTGRMPLMLGLEGSYGVGRKAELVLELRFGLESDFGSTPQDSGPHI